MHTNETNRDLGLVVVDPLELSHQLDQRSFAEGLCNRGMGRNGRILLRQGIYPPLGSPNRNKVALVQHENQVLVGAVFFQIFFDVAASGT